MLPNLRFWLSVEFMDYVLIHLTVIFLNYTDVVLEKWKNLYKLKRNNLRMEKKAEEYLARLKIPSHLKNESSSLIKKMVSHNAFGNKNYQWSLANFELGKKLGRGKFGRVFIARERDTGYIVAIKTILKKEIVTSRIERQVLREIEIQSNLKHPNILELMAWFHDSHRIYLVLEYAGKGEVYKHLKESEGGRFNEPTTAKYIYQVADAVHYCHENQVIHRDIKPENLLLTITGDVKLADFGWSVHAPSLNRNTFCGTLDYLPPEIVRGAQYKQFVDHWCLGILCFEFLTGSPPFESKDHKETYKKIRHGYVRYPDYVSEEAKDLISKLLVNKSERRLSLPEVMAHPWIIANKNLK